MQAQVNIQELRNIMATLKKAGVQKTNGRYASLVRIETTGYSVKVSGVSILLDSDLIISKSIMGGESNGVADVPFAEFDKMLTSLAKNKKVEWVRLDVLDNESSQLKIQAGSISFKLKIEDRHDIYTRHAEHLDQSYSNNQTFDEDFVTRLARASSFVDKTGMRQNLARVAVESKKDGTTSIKSTDGAMLYDFKMDNVFYSLPQGQTAFVSADATAVLAHIAKQEKIGGGSVLFTSRIARFETGGYTVTEWSHHAFDTFYFPDFSQVLPDFIGQELTVGRKGMIEAIDTASIVSSKKTNAIQLQAGHGTLIVHSEDAEAGSQVDVEVKIVHGDISDRRVYFNWKKLKQLLSTLDSNLVCIEFVNSHRACLVWEPAMKGREIVAIMPMSD